MHCSGNHRVKLNSQQQRSLHTKYLFLLFQKVPEEPATCLDSLKPQRQDRLQGLSAGTCNWLTWASLANQGVEFGTAETCVCSCRKRTRAAPADVLV